MESKLIEYGIQRYPEAADTSSFHPVSLVENETMSVSIENILLGENGAAVTLWLKNNTDASVSLTISGSLNDLPCRTGNWGSECPTVASHSELVLCLPVKSDNLEPGVEIRKFSLTCQCADTPGQAATISLQFPESSRLGESRGAFFTADLLTLVKQ